MALIKNSSSDLYERDYYAWTRNQVQALRARRIDDVDWDNVAEEIEDLGKSEKRALRSQLARLIDHLLKIDHAPAKVRSENPRGWQVSARHSRRAVAELLDENPSLQSELNQIFARAYLDGRDQALGSLKLPDSAIPEAAPWSAEQVIRDAPRSRSKSR
jgi:hypothetical protein